MQEHVVYDNTCGISRAVLNPRQVIGKLSHLATEFAWFYLSLGLIIASVINNQSWANDFYIGRLLNLLNLMCAGLILYSASDKSKLSYLVCGAAAAAFMIKSLFGLGTPYLYILNSLYLYCGALVVVHRCQILMRQLVIVASVTAFVMFLQVIGVGGWTQALTTHGIFGNGTEVTLIPQPTFLVPYNRLEANFLQGRPAGLLYSNQFASLIAIAAMGLLLSGSVRSYFRSGGPIVVFCVLTLSKVVFLAFLIMSGFKFFKVGREEKMRVIQFGGFFSAVFLVYAALFPGVVRTYLGAYSIWSSIYTRLFDLLDVLKVEDSAPVATTLVSHSTEVIGVTMTEQIIHPEQPVTGITQMIVSWPTTFLVVGFLIALLYFGKLRQPNRYRELSRSSVVVLIGILLFLLIAPFLESHAYWFFVGIGLPAILLPFAAFDIKPSPSGNV